MESTILVCFLAYTLILFGVMWLTSRRSAGNDAFFRGQRKSPWPVVAYGMIGASLSGVTFMSVPGGVYSGQFTYLPLVFGYVLGYAVIAFLLLPLYYRLNLTSIYSYLQQRFGVASEKTGALFFILSRLLGSALRMYLVVFVLYEFVFRSWGIPFWVPAVIFIAIILLYTFRGGLKTVVWTDTLQTTFLLLAAIITVVAILRQLDLSLPQCYKYKGNNCCDSFGFLHFTASLLLNLATFRTFTHKKCLVEIQIKTRRIHKLFCILHYLMIRMQHLAALRTF